MGERYAPLIDPDHFWGMSSFDIKRKPFEGPAVNIKKSGKMFEFDIAVPGYKKGELQVTLENGYLTIRGEKEHIGQDEKDGYLLEEFNFDSFERSFRLDDRIAEEKITAHYENGILHIEFEDVPEEEEKAYQEVEIS